MEDFIDTTLAFLHLPTNCGPRVALVSGGGGGTVVGSDACQRWGLDVPLLSQETQEKLKSLLPPVGSSVKNPVDVANPSPSNQVLTSVLEAVAASEQIDVIILRRIFLSARGSGLAFGAARTTGEERQGLREIPLMVKEKFGKPFIVVLHEEVNGIETIEFEADRRSLRDYYLAHGVPVYSTLERAIGALAHFVRYQEQRASH